MAEEGDLHLELLRIVLWNEYCIEAEVVEVPETVANTHPGF